MPRVPRERQLTREQIRRRVNVYRFFINIFGREMMGIGKQPFGRELFLETEAGRVRVLAYGLDVAETLPLFVNIHGGGFVMGGPEMEDRFMPGIARGAGVKILSVDYSLAPEAPFPAALEECYALVAYAKRHAADLGIDPDNVAIGGQSAGGNLSAAICLMDAEGHELGLKALVLDYPPLDIHTDPYLKPRPKKALSPRMSRVYDQAYAGTREAAKNPLISPYYAAVDQMRSLPPTLVITAGLDSLAPETEAFKDKLIEAGVAVTFKRFEGTRHGFNLMGEPGADESWQMIIDHLARYLRSASRPAAGQSGAR